MNNEPNRKCSSCVSFQAFAPGEQPMCLNGVSAIDNPNTPDQQIRAMHPDEVCDQHRTPQEDVEVDELLEFLESKASDGCRYAVQRCGAYELKYGTKHVLVMTWWLVALALDPSGTLQDLDRRRREQDQLRFRDREVPPRTVVDAGRISIYRDTL